MDWASPRRAVPAARAGRQLSRAADERGGARERPREILGEGTDAQPREGVRQRRGERMAASPSADGEREHRDAGGGALVSEYPVEQRQRRRAEAEVEGGMRPR